MGYGRYVGRVGALAVALGIGVAVANGGVANATTDPDPNQDTAQDGQNLDGTPVDNGGNDAPDGSEGPEKPRVVINGVEPNKNENNPTQRRIKPRVMVLDVLRGANVLGARRADDQNLRTVKQPVDKDDEQKQEQQKPDLGGTVAKLVAPTGNDPIKVPVPGPRVLQRTIAAITGSPQRKTAPTLRVLSGAVKPKIVVDNLTNQTQRTTAAITGASTLADPVPAPPQSSPSPTRTILNLLSSIGLRPENFPPSSPFAPIGRLLELVYAGLRRIDHQLYNEAPVATSQPISPEEAEEFGTDPTTGVVTGRVAYDPDDELEFTLVQAPQHGTVQFNPDGTYTYTPDYNKNYEPGATETFTVLVSEVTTDHLHLSGGEHTATVSITVNLAPHNTVIATLPSRGTFPEDIVMHPDGTKFYVIYHNDSKVSVFNADGTFVKDIRVGKNPDVVGNPVRMAISADGKTGYVGNFSDPSISVINLETNTLTSSFDVPGVWDLAVLPNGELYVAGSSGVTVVDPSNPTAQTLIALAGKKGDMALSPDGKLAYIAIFGESRVAVINTETNMVVGSIPVVGFVEDVKVNPVNGTIYVDDEDVSVIPAASTTATRIEVPNSRGLAVSPDGKRLYVANITFGSISIVDTATNTVVGSIPADDGAWRIALAPDGSRAYVVNTADGTISVIALLVPEVEV